MRKSVAATRSFFRGGGATINGGNYRVRGVEMSAVGAPDWRIDTQRGAAWNHSALIKQAKFHWTDGTPINFQYSW